MPALLANADFYGTLAAARSLGRHGVAVTVAHPSHLGAASWSKYAARTVTCPPTLASEAFLAWLIDFGRKEPGHVLYPTSDDAAFVYAAHRFELSRWFRLYQPSFDAIYALLNKRRLYEEGRAAGLSLPRTWFPQSAADLEAVARAADGPVMIKPVTQILFASHRKGDVVHSAEALPSSYRAFATEAYGAELRAWDPQVVQPMVQEFCPSAAQAIYSLSGFISAEGDWAMRGARKVLQLPRRLGVGICFEDAPVDPKLAQGLVSLLRRVAYFGVFEAEFIQRGDADLLIDVNPRFYGQMGFDLARGLPEALLAYEAAMGHHEAVRALLRAARETRPGQAPVYCHSAALGRLLRWQEASGALAHADAAGWRTWLGSHPTVDAVRATDDRAPAVVDALNRLVAAARHPRAFVRTMVLNR